MLKKESLSQSMNRIGRLIHSTPDLREIMARVIAEAARAVGSETAAISLRQGDYWVVRYVHGLPPDVIGTQRDDRQEPHAVLAIQTKKPVVINDAFTDERVNRAHMRKWGIHAVLVVPLVTEDEVIGVLFFNQHKPDVPFQQSHADFADQLASSLALALGNARLLEELQRELAQREKAERARQEANEQLQLQSEELRVANEELQSQTEELRAANEELQAQQEELQTQTEELRAGAQALREAHERAAWLARFPEENPNPVVRVSDKGTILYHNRAAAELPGWACKMGHSAAEPFLELVRRALAEGRQAHQDVELGETSYLVWAVPFPSEHYANVYGRDITERQRAEAQVRQSQRTFAELIERAPFGIYVVDSNFRIAQMNTGSQNGAFRNVRPVVGRDFAEAMRILWPEPVAAEITGHFRHTLDTGAPYYSPRFINPRHDVATVESYEWELHRMTLADGQHGVICYYFDSTKLREAEEALRQSEARLRALAEALPQIVWTADAAGGIEWFNQRWYEYTGQPHGRGEGWSWDQAAHADDMPPTLQKWQQAREQGALFENEIRIRRHDGQFRWFLVRAWPLRDAEGKVVRWFGTNTDIEDMKRTEAALRRSELRYRSFVEVTSQFGWVTDAAGQVVEDIPSLREFTGQTCAQAKGGGWADALHPDDVQRTLEVWGHAVATRTPYEAEYRMRRHDGVYRLLLARGVPILDDQGNVTEWVGTCIDITERKQAEERERREHRETAFANRVLRVFVEYEGDALFDQALAVVQEEMASRHGVFGYLAQPGHLICPSLSKMLDACEVPGKCIHYPPEKWKGLWARALTEKRSLYTNEARPVPPGHPLIHNNLAAPILFQGEAIGLLNLANKEGGYTDADRDTLDRIAARIAPVLYAWIQRKLREEERQAAEQVLREWNATLESRVAERTAELEHRARQLQKLTLELSQVEDRERKRMAEILHDDLQQIIAGAKFQLTVLRNRVKHDASLQALGSHIDEMLREAVEKSRTLSHEMSPAVLHRGDLTDALGWLAGQIKAKHGLVVHVRADGPADLQSEAVGSFLYKAAQELLFNVVKHARVKEARLRVQRHGSYVCVSVSDCGRGFDPQALPETAGFGLLSIRERIELLGGRMRIKSAKSRGSTFFIVVPDDGEEKKVGSEEGKKVGGSLSPSDLLTFSPSSSPGVQRLRILLADDHRIVREGLRSLLSERNDIEIVGEAVHGREAVDLALRLEPEVVIMDVAMPLIDGDEATRQIKTHRPKTRVIALSTYNESEMMQRMYRAGAEGYVLKTASAEELLAAIRGRSAAGS